MTIKDVPMMTSDEKEIVLGGIIYTANWSSGYDFSKDGKGEIEAHRIISVNNSARFFRARCVGGCETEYQYSKGCSREHIYGNLSSVKKELIRKIDEDIKKCVEKDRRIGDTLAHIREQRKVVDSIVPKEPKGIKVE